MPDDNIPPAPPGPARVTRGFFRSPIARFRRAWTQHWLRYGAANQTDYRLHTRIVLLGVFVLAVAGAVWLGRPHYRHYKERRAARLALAFLEKGDGQNAGLRARQALLLNPGNLAASQVMARLAGQAHAPDELIWQQRVTELEPTLENKLNLAELGLHWQRPPFPVTAQVIDGLAAIGATNARYQNIAAQLAIVRHEIAEAEGHFATASRLDPTNAHYALNLALFRLVLTNEAQRAESRQRLRQLRSDPVYGAEALRGLIKDRLAQKDAAGAGGYSTELLASPQAGLRDQLQNLEILRLQKDDSWRARLESIQQSGRTNAPVAAEISGWMLANDLSGNVLNWLATLPLPIQNEPALLLRQAEAYQVTGDWQGLRDFASQGNWGEWEYLRYAALAHAAAQLGAPYVARNNWDRAVNDKTAGNRAALEKLAELAARWQLKPEMTELLERLVRDFPEDNEAVRGLTQIYFGTGNTAALHQLYARLTAAFSTNADYQNNLTATALLLQTNLPQAQRWAAEAYAVSPGNQQVVIDYAYALHLQHRDAEGIAALEKLKPEELARPSPALYYGVLLASRGKAGEAVPWLKIAQAKTNLLLPEERQLLASALGGK
jgi:hypothetical protein